MKKPTFPLKVSKQGVSVTIGLVEKNGQKIFRVLYREQGKRKQAWRSTFEDAKRAADDAIEVVLTGDASARFWIVLLLTYDVVFTTACLALFDTILQAE